MYCYSVVRLRMQNRGTALCSLAEFLIFDSLYGLQYFLLKLIFCLVVIIYLLHLTHILAKNRRTSHQHP